VATCPSYYGLLWYSRAIPRVRSLSLYLFLSILRGNFIHRSAAVWLYVCELYARCWAGPAASTVCTQKTHFIPITKKKFLRRQRVPYREHSTSTSIAAIETRVCRHRQRWRRSVSHTVTVVTVLSVRRGGLVNHPVSETAECRMVRWLVASYWKGFVRKRSWPNSV
jgi:hypothetical protein